MDQTWRGKKHFPAVCEHADKFNMHMIQPELLFQEVSSSKIDFYWITNERVKQADLKKN